MGDAVKWNILVLSVVFRVQTCAWLAQVGPHLPAPLARGDAVNCNILVLLVVSEVRTCSIGSDWPASPSIVFVREMRSNGTFLFSRLFRVCKHARLTRTSRHRFDAGVFLVSTKKGVIIYPGDFFQRRLKY